MGWRDDPVIEAPAAARPAWMDDEVIGPAASDTPFAGMGEISGLSMDQIRQLPGIADFAVRQAADKMSFGLADRAAGAMDYLTGSAPSVAEGVAKERALTQQQAQEHPIGAGLAGAAGALAGGAGLIRQGVTLMPLMAGRGLIPKVGIMAAEGAGYGAADAAGHADGGLADAGSAALEGAKRGAFVGSTIPVLARGASALYSAGSRAFEAVPGMSRTSSGLLRTALGDGDAAATRLQQLGPDAMLADASPSMVGLTQGVATKPGTGRDIVTNALTGRDAGANARLGTALDDLGPAVVPSHVDAGLEASQRALGPEYERVMQSATAVDTRPLANSLEAAAVNLRGDARQAVQRVRGFLNIPGTDQLDPNPAALLQTRHAIDGLLEAETNSQVIGRLGEARRAVDAELARAVPGIKDIDAQYQELARQRAALQRGSTALDKGKTAPRPAELADEVLQGSQPAGTMVGPSAAPVRLREGARAELDRIVGQNGNDRAALQRLIGGEGDWNPQKLRTLFGEERANRMLGVLERERIFQQTFSDVARGSQTAQRQAGSAAIDARTEIPRDRSMVGLAEGAVRGTYRKIADLLSANTRQQLGQALTQTGTSRDDLVRALVEAERRRAARAGGLAEMRALRKTGVGAVVDAYLSDRSGKR